MPRAFFFEEGTLKFNCSFPSEKPKFYIPRAFNRSYLTIANLPVTEGIKNTYLRSLVEEFTFPRNGSSVSSDIGIRYVGLPLHTAKENNVTSQYYEQANNIFSRYGLTPESCGRLFEMFFQEYMHLLKKFVKEDCRRLTLGMESFEYEATIYPFIEPELRVYPVPLI